MAEADSTAVDVEFRPVDLARCAIEAESGAFERWRLRPGDHLEVKE